MHNADAESNFLHSACNCNLQFIYACEEYSTSSQTEAIAALAILRSVFDVILPMRPRCS